MVKKIFCDMCNNDIQYYHTFEHISSHTFLGENQKHDAFPRIENLDVCYDCLYKMFEPWITKSRTSSTEGKA